MLLHFVSDSFVQAGGFTASFVVGDSSLTAEEYHSEHATSEHVLCSGLQQFSARSGSLSDGSGADDYDPEMQCSFLIDVGASNPVILSFEQFSTEMSYDIVTVYDGDDTTDPQSLIGTYSGNLGQFRVVAPSGRMLLHFRSDQSEQMNGFVANWITVFDGYVAPTPQPTALPLHHPYGELLNGVASDLSHQQNKHCSGRQVLHGTTGLISDGSGMHRYKPQSECSWLIAPQVDYLHNVASIRLLFTQLDLESPWDFIKIYNGEDGSAPLLTQLSGSITQGLFTEGINAASDSLFVVFQSDASMQRNGFTATYNATTVRAPAGNFFSATAVPTPYQHRTAGPTGNTASAPPTQRAGYQAVGCEQRMLLNAPSGLVLNHHSPAAL
jgi:hypothetical protein